MYLSIIVTNHNYRGLHNKSLLMKSNSISKSLMFVALLSIYSITTAQMDKQLISKIDTYIKPYIETKNFNGTILVAKNGNILYHNSFGYANEDFNIKNYDQTIYHIASVSKNFTAAAILILEQKGLLKTTDLLGQYISDYPIGSKITIHQLLTHTSGVPNINDMPEYVLASKNSQTPESLIRIFKNVPLEFEPGSKYKYSNSNYNLLAFIIEKVSGVTYGEFLKKEIFSPLGMQHTAHDATAKNTLTNTSNLANTNDVLSKLAVGYQSDGKFGLEKADYIDWSSKTGNGSLYTTSADLLAWDRALANNTILSKASQEKMYTNYISNTGYGCFVKEHLKRKRYYMNGRSPGFTSYFARYPEDELCIVVLANNYIPVATQVGMDIAAIVYNEKYEPLNLSAKPVDAQIANKLVGTYKFNKDFYRPNFIMTVSEKDGHLIIDWGELIPTGQSTFIARTYWSDVSFETDSHGKVTKMVYDGYEAEKVK